MFENIIGLEKVKNLLITDFKNKSFNNSMIFHGQKSTGKLTVALELTRVLNCLKKCEIDCNCFNCNSIRDLNFKGLLFLSRRNFLPVLKEYINSYNNNREKKYFDSIVKTVKLCMLPLQEFLIKDIFSETEKNMINENSYKLYIIISKNEFSDEDLLTIEKIITEIQDLYKKPNIPVDEIRSMLDWSYIAQPDINRVVIIDGIDYFEESSKNCLLKRLEEPSSNLFFILLAENKNKIIKTIISRCRSYYFQKPSPEMVQKIIFEKFGEQDYYENLNDFLNRSFDTSRLNIFPKVIKLFNYVFQKEHTFFELEGLLQSYNDRKLAKALLSNIEYYLQKEYLDRQLNNEVIPEIKILRKINDFNLKLLIELIQEKYNKFDIYNLNPVWLLEGIFYPIKAMVLNDKI